MCSWAVRVLEWTLDTFLGWIILLLRWSQMSQNWFSSVGFCDKILAFCSQLIFIVQILHSSSYHFKYRWIWWYCISCLPSQALFLNWLKIIGICKSCFFIEIPQFLKFWKIFWIDFFPPELTFPTNFRSTSLLVSRVVDIKHQILHSSIHPSIHPPAQFIHSFSINIARKTFQNHCRIREIQSQNSLRSTLAVYKFTFILFSIPYVRIFIIITVLRYM